MHKALGLTLAALFIFSGCGQQSIDQRVETSEKDEDSISCLILERESLDNGVEVDLRDIQKEAEEFAKGIFGYKGKMSEEEACTYTLYNSFMMLEDYPTIMAFDKSDAEIQVGIDAFSKKYGIENVDILYELLALEREVMNR